VDSAVAAMKLGAEDYLEKPIDMEKMKIVLGKIAEKRGLQSEIAALRRQQKELYRKDYLFLPDPEMQKLYGEIEQIANQEKVTVVIYGETGTGKEHVARLIHTLSPRKSRPFVELHCGSLPESILESELFGYEPGAFTDAKRQKQGLFEEAQGGTVFLDEIGELTPSVQMKLLKVLEQKTIRRLGGNREIPLDVRIITATHRDLEKEVKEGRFRADLFYRLNVIPLTVPSLRQRPDDVVQLANFFLQESCRAFNKKLSLLSDDILNLLRNYHWPGNVRELKHVIERLVVTAKESAIAAKDLPKEIREAKAPKAPGEGPVMSRDVAEKKNIQRALLETKNNKSNAAKLLGVTRKTLFNKMKKYSLE
jgi:DNA-binding NtrC family response regulator